MQIEELIELLTQIEGFPSDIIQLAEKSKEYFNKEQYDKAAEYIEKAIEKIEYIEKELSINIDCNLIKKFFGAAGEAYAYNDDEKKSLETFQKYQFHLIRCADKGDDVSEGLLSFRRFTEYSLSDLINKEITLCHPKVMNDPFDTLLIKWGENLKKIKADKKHVKPLVDSFDYFRVRSFCRLMDDEKNQTIKNFLMWSHYANEHKGFCIRYKFYDDFTKTGEKSTTIFKNIDYQEKIDKKIGKIINQDPVTIDIESIRLDRALYTKHKAWKYENEVRLISYAPDESGDFIQIPLEGKAKIVSIYFGSRCDDRHIKTIQGILKDQDISFYKMIDNPIDIYNMKIEDISKQCLLEHSDSPLSH